MLNKHSSCHTPEAESTYSEWVERVKQNMLAVSRLKASVFDVFCHLANPPMDPAFIADTLKHEETPTSHWMIGAKVPASSNMPDEYAVFGITYPADPDGKVWIPAAAVLRVDRNSKGFVSLITPVGGIVYGKKCIGPGTAGSERYKMTRDLLGRAHQVIADNADRGDNIVPKKRRSQGNTPDSDCLP